MQREKRGVFATIEGVEGTGKSTLTTRLFAELTELGITVIVTREPGGSSIGVPIRSLLLRSDLDMPILTARAEALLFAADRAQHVAELIKPALEEGKVVLCDRFIASSIAYQGVGRDLGAKKVKKISHWAIDGCFPEVTLLVDLDPAVGIARKSIEEVNRMENEPIEFHNKIRQAFLKLSKDQKSNTSWYVIDGSQDLETVYVIFRNIVLATWLLKNIEEGKYRSIVTKALNILDIEYNYNPEEVTYPALKMKLINLLDSEPYGMSN